VHISPTLVLLTLATGTLLPLVLQFAPSKLTSMPAMAALVAALSKNGFLSLPPVEQRQLIRPVKALIPWEGTPAESGDTGGGETGEGTPTSESTSDPDFC
jgi:hypothetical protein